MLQFVMGPVGWLDLLYYLLVIIGTVSLCRVAMDTYAMYANSGTGGDSGNEG